MSGSALTEGIERILVDGVEVALDALRDGWAQRKLKMDALWHYATIDRVANVMRPYLQSVSA